MVKFAIIGTNSISSKFLAGALHSDKFALSAIYSRKQETAQIFLDKHEITGVEIFTDFSEFASSDSYQAAYVASPNTLHHPQSIALMKNGKHVLCEKPIATTLHEAQEMAETAIDNKIVLMEAVKTTMLPNYHAVVDNLHKIGRIRRYTASYCQYSSRYDSLKQGIMLNAFDPQMAGGALLDIGIYCIYPMITLFGTPKSYLSSGEQLSTGVDGYGSAIFNYDGFDAVALYSKIADSQMPTEIQGEEGTIIIEKINTFAKVTLRLMDGSIEDLSRPTIPQDMYYEVQEFISLVERNGQSGQNEQSTINSLQTSLIVTELMEGIRKKIGVEYPADQYR